MAFKISYAPLDPTNPAGALCVQSLNLKAGPPTPSDLAFQQFAGQQIQALNWCPAIPPPSVSARRFWTERQLPDPLLRIQPGSAVVGLLAYLEINAPTTMTFTVPDGFGNTIAIAAVGSFTVDWGDGTIENVGQDRGGPYPNGDVNHAYQSAGNPTITVTETWSASWTSAGVSGNLGGGIPARTTVGALANFPVRDVQANRDR